MHSRAHPGQSILSGKLLAQGACQRGQTSARPIGAHALVPDHFCGKVQSACRRRPVHNACAVTWQHGQKCYELARSLVTSRERSED